MERGEWDDDAEYPNAPLPAHERTWRHPSEHGATQWVQSEPPLVVGRGLSVATGTVGVVLAVGLLWLMVPHDNRTSSGVSAQSSTSLKVAAGETFVTRHTSSLLATVPAELSSGPVTTAPAVTSSQPVAATTTAPPPPVATTTGATDTTLGPLETSTPQPPIETVQLAMPTAVALAPGHFVVATASAVGDQETMTVQLPTGGTAVGTVVTVDLDSGIAVLSVPNGTEMGLIQPSQIEIPTDSAVVMAPDPTPASVWRNDSGTQLTWDPAVPVAEGSLVLDNDAHLIGMCTSGGHGIHVIDASSMLAAINSAIANESPAWLGLHVGITDAGELTVLEINADGPAATAGVQVGAVIQALDGAPISGADGMAALRSSVTSHAPGDVLTLTMLAPGASVATDVAVTLAQNPGSI